MCYIFILAGAVNTRPYRLPEAQKLEVRRQVEELKRKEL